jgi:hypothetical protein
LENSYLDYTKVEPPVNKEFIYNLIPEEDRIIIASVCMHLWSEVSDQKHSELPEEGPLWPYYLLRVTSHMYTDVDDVVESFGSESAFEASRLAMEGEA